MQTRSRQVAVLLFEELELFDVAAPLSVLSTAGRHWNWRPFKVHTVAEQPGALASRSQLSVLATSELSACPAPEIVIVPGGYGARKALERPAVRDWLAHAGAGAALVGGIGNGVLLLAATGLLAGREVAARDEIADTLVELDPTLRVVGDKDAGASRALVESDKVLSASTSGASLELALRIVSRVLGEKLANTTAQALGVPWIAPEAKAPVELKR